jgi:hypothetical protein
VDRTRKRIAREALAQIRLELGPRSALVLRPEGLWIARLRMQKHIFGRGGQNMVPFTEHQNADIAQLVEQVIRNDQVVGSNPTIGSPQKSFTMWRLKTQSAGQRDGSTNKGVRSRPSQSCL